MPTLHWIGKQAVINHHKEVPFRLFHCDPALSVGEPDGNLLIEGDNLEALKALLPYYAGQVKCIYIDPPYNTGNENWVYNDNVNSPHIRAWLGKVVGGEGEDLARHDKWLCMMYPRLALLRELLRENGVIFVSIDDTEVAHLRCVMDEIFGEENFVANVVWQKKQSPQNDAINLSDMHDHILVYAKCIKTDRNDKNGWQRNLLLRGEIQDKRYTNPDNDLRGDWASVDATCNKSAEERPNLYYSVINPNTGEEIWPSRRRVWLFEKSVFEQCIRENRVWWGSSGKNFPRLKRFRSEVAEGIVPSTWWDREQAGDNQEARREIRDLFRDIDFSTPKPTRLIRRILHIATNPGDLVLDSFAGSGSTGHAVLQLNREDGGNRRFILVEIEPHIARAITAERLRRVIQGYTWVDQKGNQRREEGLGGGLRYCALGATIFNPDGSINPAVAWEDLARHVWFTETCNPWLGKPSSPAPLPQAGEGNTWLGAFNGVSYYLFFNGIGGNLFGAAQLAELPLDDAPKVVYADAVSVGQAEMEERKVTFKQIPYDVKGY
jgi:site-specific DNA-methyltransferase (adenine-specific)/adenine-specific DNA-methyltransferase